MIYNLSQCNVGHVKSLAVIAVFCSDLSVGVSFRTRSLENKTNPYFTVFLKTGGHLYLSFRSHKCDFSIDPCVCRFEILVFFVVVVLFAFCFTFISYKREMFLSPSKFSILALSPASEECF